jgi:hypothetical protein
MISETFPALLQRLYREQFTGSVTMHFGQGVPTTVEIPAPPTRIVLDKRDVPPQRSFVSTRPSSDQ